MLRKGLSKDVLETLSFQHFPWQKKKSYDEEHAASSSNDRVLIALKKSIQLAVAQGLGLPLICSQLGDEVHWGVCWN